MHLNIIGNRKIFLGIAGVLILAALLAIFIFGFKEGIDFSGGTLWQFKASDNQPSALEMESFFQNDLGLKDARVNYESVNNSFLARLSNQASEEHQALADKIRTRYPSFQELSFQSIGPSVGIELRNKSLTGIALVIVGISLYIAYAFRKVYRPVSSWKYGWVTLFSLFHDVVIPAGMLAILGKMIGIEIDGNFVVALLVVMGFSVHDTIVVFDRIRENLFLDRGKTDFSKVINDSINQTLARSINTSLTLILVLLALLFVGPETLKYFILTLLVGVVTGMYSSIFVASPLLLVWQKASKNSR